MISKLIALLLLSSLTAFAETEPMKIITSTTDVAWAVKKIGGDLVEVRSLLKGTENPHYVDAVPEFIRLAAEAQAVFSVGLDLEIGWLPKVLARSGNAQVQPGGKGYAELGKAISVLEKPTGAVDRSMGDVHPSGNPHFWLSPKAFAQAGPQVAETLSKLDPAHATNYQKGLKNFETEMNALVAKNQAKLRPVLSTITGPALLEYHKEFAYFLETYGLKSLGSVEEKPGVAPSAGRLGEIAMQAKAAKIRLVLAADTAPKKTLERFSELSQIPIVTLPLSVVPNGKWKDYVALHDFIVEELLRGLRKAQVR